VIEAVSVRLFARFRDAFGMDSIEVALPAGATVKEVREQIALLNPGITNLLARSQVAVNGELASDEVPVRPGDEVAVLPPVSGG
jgi:molybdopterin converting factor subunit 1